MLYLAQIGSLSKLIISDLVMQLHDCCMQLHYFVIYIGKKDTSGVKEEKQMSPLNCKGGIFSKFFCNRVCKKDFDLGNGVWVDVFHFYYNAQIIVT